MATALATIRGLSVTREGAAPLVIGGCQSLMGAHTVIAGWYQAHTLTQQLERQPQSATPKAVNYSKQPHTTHTEGGVEVVECVTILSTTDQELGWQAGVMELRQRSML